MAYPLFVNDLQRYRLYEVLLLQEGKGAAHWRRVNRLYDALKVEEIEEMDRKSRDDEGKPRTYDFKQPQTAYFVDEADLEYLHRLVKDWDKEEGMPKNLNNATANWKVFLPLMDAVIAAWEGRKEASKSNGEKTEKEAVQNP